MNSPVLVIDDEVDLRSLVRDLLEDWGYGVVEAADGAQGLRLLYEHRPAAVILDITMPRMDGWQILERVRELSDVPVLILSSRGGELERVRGLRSGADDYLVKPFSGEELVARIEALLRRRPDAVQVRDGYGDSAVAIDVREHRVTVRGEPVSLTPLEFRLLHELLAHPRQVLSHEQLLERVWHDPHAVSPDQVRLYVGYLRRKLGPERDRVETVRGFGYRYVPPLGRSGGSAPDPHG